VRREGGRLLRATLRVLEGAFRFTTDVATRARYQEAALALYDGLRRDGYPARIRPVSVDKRNVYFVRLEGFASRAEAQVLGERLREAYPGVLPDASR